MCRTVSPKRNEVRLTGDWMPRYIPLPAGFGVREAGAGAAARGVLGAVAEQRRVKSSGETLRTV